MSLTKQILYPTEQSCAITFIDDKELYVAQYHSFFVNNIIANIMYDKFVAEIYQRKIDISYGSNIRLKFKNDIVTIYYQHNMIFRTIVRQPKSTTFCRLNELLIKNNGDNIILYTTCKLNDDVILYEDIMFYKLCYVSSVTFIVLDLLIDIFHLKYNCYRIEKLFNGKTQTLAVYYIDQYNLPEHYTAVEFKNLNTLQIMYNNYNYSNDIVKQLSTTSNNIGNKDITITRYHDYIVSVCDNIDYSRYSVLDIKYCIILNVEERQNTLLSDLYTMHYISSNYIFYIHQNGIYLSTYMQNFIENNLYQLQKEDMNQLQQLQLYLPFYNKARQDNISTIITQQLLQGTEEIVKRRLFNLSLFLRRLTTS